MLKFISTDSDDNCLNSSLPEIKDIDDFLNKKSAKEIVNYISSKFEGMNTKEKSASNFINKILPMMFFEHLNKNRFSFGENTKAIIEKILEVSLEANELNNSHLENFVKFYFIISSNVRGRYFLIIKFLNFLNKESSGNKNFLNSVEFKFEDVENMLSDFLINEKTNERKEMVLFYEELSTFIFRNQLFENLNR